MNCERVAENTLSNLIELALCVVEKTVAGVCVTSSIVECFFSCLHQHVFNWCCGGTFFFFRNSIYLFTWLELFAEYYPTSRASKLKLEASFSHSRADQARNINAEFTQNAWKKVSRQLLRLLLFHNLINV